MVGIVIALDFIDTNGNAIIDSSLQERFPWIKLL